MDNQKLKSALSNVFFALFSVFVSQAVTFAEPLAKITVEAGRHTRVDTPVHVSLESIGNCPSDGELQLVEIKGSQRLLTPSQIERGDNPKIWWILCGKAPAGSKHIYELVKDSEAECDSKSDTAIRKLDAESVSVVELTKNDTFLQIDAKGSKVLRYHHALCPPPQGASEKYIRSGFIHPLWSPSGEILTEIHPPDHIHHMGIWMPWTKSKFEGKEVNFWDLKDGGGTVRFVEFVSLTSGPVYGGFLAKHEHIALDPNEGDKIVLKEIWDVRVYNVGGPERGYWIWDFVSTQRCATDSSLHLFQYRYGGLGFRATNKWKQGNCDYLTSEGKTRIDGHATRARWCDMYGVTGDGWAGVTVMSHPENFQHPEPMRIWPEGHVFFNFTPSQLGDWTMEPGKDYVFRYRFYVHEGKVVVADSERLWKDFAEPPKIKLEKVSERAVKSN